MHRLKRHCFTSTRGSFLFIPLHWRIFWLCLLELSMMALMKAIPFWSKGLLVTSLHSSCHGSIMCEFTFSQVHTHYYVYLAIQIHKIWMCLLLWQSSMFHDYGWLRIAFAGQSATSISFIYLLPTSLNWHECIPFLSGLLLLYTRWFYHPFPQFLKMTLINWAFVCTQLLPKPMKW